MRYANEGRHLLPQGSTTGVPQEYHTKFVPTGQYHRSTTGSLVVTTGQYYMLMLPHDMCMYHTCRSSTTGQCHTLVTTEQYHICCYHMRLPHPRYYVHSGVYTT